MAGPLPALAVRALRGFSRSLLALLILFEEWGWDPLQRALARLGRLPLLRQAEAGITRLPPYAALVVFLVPALLLLPVKLLALGLIAQGQRLVGLGVIVVAKLVGTAVVARLFNLTRPALMRLPWFARVHGRWSAWKAALLAQVRVSWAWRQARVLRRQARRALRHWAGWRRG
jgi:hypothetical protein